MKSRDTKPELILREQLRRHGIRFDTHVRALPGTPDVVVSSSQIAIFVNGCHWHRHFNCLSASGSERVSDYWLVRFGQITARDSRNALRLHLLGWTALTVWECELKRHPVRVFARVAELIRVLEDSGQRHLMMYQRSA